MTRKKAYLGATIPPPYNKPQYKTIPNPDKHDTVCFDRHDLREFLHLLNQVNDVGQLRYLSDRVSDALDKACLNAGLSDTVQKVNWSGSIVREYTRCNKPECRKCSGSGRGHGPYFYRYSSD